MAIIFLNGCTSAGKTSIAKALQGALDEPYLMTGIDDALRMIPSGLHDSPDGVEFVREGERGVRLRLGPFGRAVLEGHQRAVAAMAQSGLNLVLDEVVLDSDLRRGWLSALGRTDVFFVGVYCDLAELERREEARGDRLVGQARAQFDVVHDGMRYDLTVDTTSTDTQSAVATIMAAMSAGEHA